MSEERSLTALFANRLRTLMNRAGVTRQELAGALAIHDSAVSKWLGGQTVPGAKYISALAAYFDTPASTLLFADGLINGTELRNTIVDRSASGKDLVERLSRRNKLIQADKLTNFQKARLLRDVRRRLGWSQVEMGEALGLDSSYLSQLENDKRPIDHWYVNKAMEFGARRAQEGSAPIQGTSPGSAGTVHQCREFLDEFLKSCGDDESKLEWTLVELREHFPLNKWNAIATVSAESTNATIKRPVNSKPPSAAATLLRKSADEGQHPSK